MKMRFMVPIAFVLGCFGAAMARQDVGSPKAAVQRAADSADLKVKVGRLRADVEILQIEHEIDAKLLKALIEDVKNLEILESSKGLAETALGELQKQVKELPAEPNPGLGLPAGLLGGLAQPNVQAEISKMFALGQTVGKVGRPILDRLRGEYVRKATELNIKHLELDESEKFYAEFRRHEAATR